MFNYWMNDGLKRILNTVCYNLQRDFDGVILMSGRGMVRVGKSVFAQQIGHYCSTRLNTSWGIDNIVFTGKELMDKAKTKPKNTVFVYDEARGELDTKKVMEEITRTLLDFFAECGMYNHLIIIVLPDFFDLPKGIAISRSELLIDVGRKGKDIKLDSGEMVTEFVRGSFNGYLRNEKKKLYILGKKDYNNYECVSPFFWGEFPNTFTVDFKEYEAKKKEYLARDRTKDNTDYKFDTALKVLCTHISTREASKELKSAGLSIHFNTIQFRINKLLENEPTMNNEQ